jgi:integrase
VFAKIDGKVRAFFLVLASTSLRIGDVVSLPRSKVEGNTIMLSTGKTNQPVFLKLPPMAVEALNGFPSVSPKYFFWTGHGKLDTAKADWSEDVEALPRRRHRATLACLPDTLTTAVLGAGGNLETAAALLGHRDVKVTKHYEHWDTERQAARRSFGARVGENSLAEARPRGLPTNIVEAGRIGKKEELLAALEAWFSSGSANTSPASSQGGDFESPPFTLEDFHRD